MKDTVFVFVKAPRLGALRRSHHQQMGEVQALLRYRQALSRTLRALAADPRYRTIVAATPDVAARGRPPWACGLQVIEQGRGSLGQRMTRITKRYPRGRVAIVGGDVPGVTGADVAHGFKMLGQAHACFGPSTDGGYWLVALSPRRPDAPFGIVRWSTEWALEDTLANFVGRQVALLRELTPLDPVDPRAARRRAA